MSQADDEPECLQFYAIDSGTPNPSHDEPIPDAIQAWGHSVHRPKQLPPEDSYDTRIDSSQIFAFPYNPSTELEGEYFVVARPCDYCKKLKQRCTRGDPSHPCDRCQRGQIQCLISQKGWDLLPRPKVDRPRKGQVRSAPKGEAAQVADGSRYVGGRALRLKSSKTESYLEHSDREDGQSDALDTKPVCAGDHKSQGTRALKVKKPQEHNGSSQKARENELVPKRQKWLSIQKAKKPAKAKAKKSSRKAQPPTPNYDWRAVSPPSPFDDACQFESIRGNDSRPTAPGVPRIWASSKADLFQVLPHLSQAVHGISWTHSETPILLLDGPSWPEDSWDGGKSITLSMYREFNVDAADAEKQAQTIDINMTGPDHDDIVVDTDRPLTTESDPPMALITPAINNELAAPFHLRPTPSTSTTILNAIHTPFTSRGRHSYPHPLHPHSSLRHFNEDGSYSSSSRSPTPRFAPNVQRNLYEQSSPPRSHINMHQPWSCDNIDNEEICFSDTPYESLPGSVSWVGRELPSSQSGILTGSFPPEAAFYDPTGKPIAQDEGHAAKRRRTGYQPAESCVRTTVCHPSSSIRSPTPCSRHAASPPSVSSVSQTPSDHESRAIMSKGRNGNASPTVDHLPVAIFDPLSDSYLTSLEICSPKITSLDMKSEDVTDEHPKPTTDDDKSICIPPELPPEIQVLLDCHRSRIPVNLITFRDFGLLPFTLSDEYKCVFLGFFQVQDVELSVTETLPAPTGRTAARVRWRFNFLWIPGGEVADIKAEQPKGPWWMPAGDACIAEEEPQLHPYMVLPMNLAVFETSETSTATAEVCARKGWHCPTCGKLNVQRLLCFQRCSKCSTGNGMSPVAAMYVRSPYSMAPVSFPWDRYPRSVTSHTTNGSNKMLTFWYTISEQILVKHLFTCNFKDLQEEPSRLFRDLQMKVELTWQGHKTDLAAGPYYTYLAGNGDEAVPWDDVPGCISKSRELMEHLAQANGQERTFALDQLTVLAWHTPGNRKSPTPLPAKKHRVAILCLGADVELNIFPKSGFRAISEPHPNIKTSLHDEHAFDPQLDGPDEFEPIDPMDLDEDEDKREDQSGLFRLAQVAAEVQASAGSDVANTSSGGKEQHTEKGKPNETLFITMVHGDMLILSGDDFEWSMKRTGMSIVLIGLSPCAM